jgi:hypothetical protein
VANLILNRPKTHLIIPDSHATPGKHNKRYEWLGHLINDIKPDIVIDIGDWWDMPSLCSYDKGTKGFEGRRYKADIEAGLDAQQKVYDIVRRNRKKLPKFIRTLGNHENRISKAIDRDPILEGTIGLSDLQSREYGWMELPFLHPIAVDGITYSHYFTSGIMGRPIGGERHASTLITKKLTSCTQGHSHLFDYHVRSDIHGRKIHGCVVGVYQDYRADFAGPANDLWDPGVVVKRDVQDGSYDIERISIARLKREYENC